MTRELPPRRIILGSLLALAGLAGIYLTSLSSYLLFHSIVELVTIAAGLSVFFITWNSRRNMDTGCLPFMGLALLFVSGLDLLHTLSYKGMGVFAGTGANLSTQF